MKMIIEKLFNYSGGNVVLNQLTFLFLGLFNCNNIVHH